MLFPTIELNKNLSTSRPFKGILSIWGDFGVGKTTLALQIAIAEANLTNVIFLYSKPNFPFEKVGSLLQNKQLNILDKLKFVNILNFLDLHKIILNFEFLLLKNSSKKLNSIGLIALDSITDLYRLELNKDNKEKNFNLNYQLNQILASLFYLNYKYKVEILIVNDVSRKLFENHINEVQGGGKVMDYWLTHSIKLIRTEKLNQRKFILTKHQGKEIVEFTSNMTSNGFE
ncbi:MAG: hypothetical protein ACFFAO_04215 [Candidatus Hermodarchaeota archaeon]